MDGGNGNRVNLMKTGGIITYKFLGGNCMTVIEPRTSLTAKHIG